MDNGEAMPDKGDNRQLTVDYLTTLEIRGEIILVSQKKIKNFYRLTEPVFTGGVEGWAFLKNEK